MYWRGNDITVRHDITYRVATLMIKGTWCVFYVYLTKCQFTNCYKINRQCTKINIRFKDIDRQIEGEKDRVKEKEREREREREKERERDKDNDS